MRVHSHSFSYNSAPNFLLHKIITSIRLRLLRWHHLPLFQNSLIRISSTTAPRLQLHYGFNAGIPEFTLVLNYNTLPTMHNTELIRLSTRWLQRKQFRSKGSVSFRRGLFWLMARSDTGSTGSDTNYNAPTKLSRIFSQDIHNGIWVH
jgi:hypothetical protein